MQAPPKNTSFWKLSTHAVLLTVEQQHSMYSSFTQNHEFLTGMNYCVHACNINSMKVNVLGLIYIIKKLRVPGTHGMRQGGRLKMCSPHRLIMKERNFSEF